MTSRYPLWDLKHPERTAGITHSAPDAMTITDAARGAACTRRPRARRAAELGIPMPFTTVKPLGRGDWRSC